MKALKAKIGRALPRKARLIAADNSGAKILEIIGVRNYGGVSGRVPAGRVGDLVSCAVKQGNPDMKHKVVLAVIIRQKKPFRRPNGMRVRFEDNAAVVVKSESGDPKGSVVKGPVAKEAIQRFSHIGKIASVVY